MKLLKKIKYRCMSLEEIGKRVNEIFDELDNDSISKDERSELIPETLDLLKELTRRQLSNKDLIQYVKVNNGRLIINTCSK